MRNGTTVTEAPKYDPRADEKAHVARLRVSLSSGRKRGGGVLIE